MNILYEIEKLMWEMKDKHMDGYYCWDRKQKLYEIKWAVEKALVDAPVFHGEKEWMEERLQGKNSGISKS